jgi:hypothetical protein
MKALLVCGACVVVVAEILAFLLLDRKGVLWFSGVAVALTFLALRWLLARGVRPEPSDDWTDDRGAALGRWLARTQSQIAWSEATRADWDRRLRPMLARQFELGTGQRRARNPRAFEATGRVLFGDELWAWVDPENISRTGAKETGPGRAALNDILERLERL